MPTVPKGLITREPDYWKYPGNEKSDGWKNYTDYSCFYRPIPDHCFKRKDPKYVADVEKYKQDKVILDEINKRIAENPKENAKMLAKQKQKFDHHSFSLATTIDPTEYLRVQAKYSKGFRAPTSDEMYFTFKHPSFTLYSNFDLKPETANTKELAFTLYKNNSFVTLSGFRTDYKDFIELVYRGKMPVKVPKNDGSIDTLYYETYINQNQQKAQVTGFEINSKLYLEELSEKLSSFSVGYKYTYQKGKIKGKDGYHPMNAIQPQKHVVSLGYVAPSKKFGLDVYWTHVAAKKAKDTYNQFHGENESTYAKYLTKSFNVFDLVGFYKPIKNLTLQAGVYNLFNNNYLTWENARSIRTFGTSNMVCQGENKALGCNTANQGIERFHSPERNFKFNVSYEF